MITNKTFINDYSITFTQKKYKKIVKMNKIIITKKIAKQGKNSIIFIPSYLNEKLSPGKIIQLEITCLEDFNAKEINKNE